ncbi:MAG: sugar ABC transporter ATP-binding protein [Candidatus Sumerlaeia bacterium]|nr:sugar ABC transporter ATP-binding protein [Candidatus Sumerlaeia bacterium]
MSFSVRRGSALGVVGENGAGKSTLMNILGGVVRPDSGTLHLDGQPYQPRNPADASRHGIAFIHQELNLFANLSIAENLFLDSFPRRTLGRLPTPFICRRTLRNHAQRLLADVDLRLPPDLLIEDLSPGERQLVEIAKALALNARVIIFDEPTTSLTAHEAERLFALIERLRAQGASILYISHILGDVRRLCDALLVLRDGEVVGFGPVADFPIPRMISLMVGRDVERLYPARPPVARGPAVLEARGLSQPGVIHNVHFTLHAGEILGVAGLMGSGRTELARILFGLDPCETGDLLLRGEPIRNCSPRERIRRGMAFLTENRREEGLLMDASVAENIALASLSAFARSPLRLLDFSAMNEATAREADRVRLRCASIRRQAAKTLSGGNQQKAVLAKWLLASPAVVVLDEPTRGIDIGAKHEVYGLIAELAAGGAAVLFISSEIEELIGMCDRILVMRQGEIRAALERREFDQERILRAALGEGDEP